MHEVYNIGNRTPVRMGDVLELLQSKLGIRSNAILSTGRSADEPVRTCADTSKLRAAIQFEPATPIERGLDAFASWYLLRARAKHESGSQAALQAQ